MVAKLDGPQFSGGANIAIKCPAHTYDQTVAFYRDTLALLLIQPVKGAVIALQWRLGMHGFEAAKKLRDAAVASAG